MSSGSKIGGLKGEAQFTGATWSTRAEQLALCPVVSTWVFRGQPSVQPLSWNNDDHASWAARDAGRAAAGPRPAWRSFNASVSSARRKLAVPAGSSAAAAEQQGFGDCNRNSNSDRYRGACYKRYRPGASLEFFRTRRGNIVGVNSANALESRRHNRGKPSAVQCDRTINGRE